MKTLAAYQSGLLARIRRHAKRTESRVAYVGSTFKMEYHAILYFDTSSTGTRPYFFAYRPDEQLLSEFLDLDALQRDAARHHPPCARK